MLPKSCIFYLLTIASSLQELIKIKQIQLSRFLTSINLPQVSWLIMKSLKCPLAEMCLI
jgi:hypothetical protein